MMPFDMQVKHQPRLHPDWIDSDALEIVEILQEAGHTTYLVGGCVRDLLAGVRPKDFDIATDARPEAVKSLINRAYIIGRRFRLVLVRRGEKQFEVATFRREPKPEDANGEEAPFGDNIFGSPEEDARRRDFTINSMFYDPVKNELIDYCEGKQDVEDGLIRIIGDAETRLKEDPIRILRALRFAHKLKFSIEPGLRRCMLENAGELSRSVLPRRREEVLKLLRLDDPARTLHEAHDLGILKTIAPALDSVFQDPHKLEEFDRYLNRFHEFVQDITSPAELFGGLLLAWYRSMVNSDPHTVPAPVDFLGDPAIKNFFRDQLGMSNLEQSMIASALHLQPSLKEIDKIQRRGPRRQISFLKHDAFSLALLFGKADHCLTATEVHYWEKAYAEAAPQIADAREERRGRRHRPPRRRRGGGGGGSGDRNPKPPRQD